MSALKVCNVCLEAKPYTAFHLSKGGIGGVRADCKQCRKLYYQQRAEPAKEAAKLYYQANRDTRRAYFKQRNSAAKALK
jgi:hypothetical protein